MKRLLLLNDTWIIPCPFPHINLSMVPLAGNSIFRTLSVSGAVEPGIYVFDRIL